MPVLNEEYDVVVVGAGHAGCEAALASARLGLNTIIFTVSMDSVAMMPCNPNVGGSSKGLYEHRARLAFALFDADRAVLHCDLHI